MGPVIWELPRSRSAEDPWNGAPERVTAPSAKDADPPDRYPSRVGHVKPGLNRRGPSRKAKHSMTTDSEPSRATERWEEPRSGEDTEPETPCLRAVGGRWPSGPPDRVPFA